MDFEAEFTGESDGDVWQKATGIRMKHFSRNAPAQLWRRHALGSQSILLTNWNGNHPFGSPT